jgi:hypothetical protein
MPTTRTRTIRRAHSRGSGSHTGRFFFVARDDRQRADRPETYQNARGVCTLCTEGSGNFFYTVYAVFGLLNQRRNATFGNHAYTAYTPTDIVK